MPCNATSLPLLPTPNEHLNLHFVTFACNPRQAHYPSISTTLALDCDTLYCYHSNSRSHSTFNLSSRHFTTSALGVGSYQGVISSLCPQTLAGSKFLWCPPSRTCHLCVAISYDMLVPLKDCLQSVDRDVFIGNGRRDILRYRELIEL